MKSKIKPESLKLGEKLYFLYGFSLGQGIKEVVVTGLQLDKSGNVQFYINGIEKPYYDGSSRLMYQAAYGSYITRSYKKAKRVFDKFENEARIREIKQQRKTEIYEANKANVKLAEGNYKNRYVMVKFSRPDKTSKYEKVTIDALYPTDKKDTYAFSTVPRTNHYLTSRENKNWYFWSELEELRQKKLDIENRIIELETKKWIVNVAYNVIRH